MHRLILHNLGPVKDCDIAVNDFMVFTGPQASGKSTIAKAIFFFRLVIGRIKTATQDQTKQSTPDKLIENLQDQLISIFIRLFMPFIIGNKDFFATYYYSERVYIQVEALPSENQNEIVALSFCDSIKEYLLNLYKRVTLGTSWKWSVDEKTQLGNLLSEPYSSFFFIPAGRSSVTLMANQLGSVFDEMNLLQRLRTDFCVEYYVSIVREFQMQFSRGIDGILSDMQLLGERAKTPIAKKTQQIIHSILGGEYCYQNGMSTLLIGPDNKAIEMNYASSGQQEAVWITNFIFYLIIAESPVSLIVEEPESNLYPDTQKKMTELLSLFHNAGNQVLITTHSPYVLGTLNNLIYASDIAARGVSGVEKIIDRDIWLDKDKVSAWHMENGVPDPATEGELGLIRSEDIDGASIDLTEESDKLYELSAKEDAL